MSQGRIHVRLHGSTARRTVRYTTLSPALLATAVLQNNVRTHGNRRHLAQGGEDGTLCVTTKGHTAVRTSHNVNADAPHCPQTRPNSTKDGERLNETEQRGPDCQLLVLPTDV
ncbi:hypothetical protein J6590_054133 [Homalodisca vitripennis]|nr:hypothetical protein J6590_054133 [Homalodisca vitripennis]